MVLAAAPVVKAKEGSEAMEKALVADMEKRLKQYRRLRGNVEEKINSLEKSAARRQATPLFGSNEINPDFLKNIGVQRSTAKQVEIYRKELAALGPLIASMDSAQ
ncbi:Uncharacterised protein [uncultured archaeon]|nr:Uncharacterised protein [uncultured archaeon]